MAEKSKYVLVQVVSRGGDYLINNAIVYSGGFVLVALVVATFFNLSSGYLGQKYWAFGKVSSAEIKKIGKEKTTFIILRVGFGLLGLIPMLFMYYVLQWEYWISSGLPSLVIWYLSYDAQKDLFSGFLRHLPRPIRTARIIVIKRIRFP